MPKRDALDQGTALPDDAPPTPGMCLPLSPQATVTPGARRPRSNGRVRISIHAAKSRCTCARSSPRAGKLYVSGTVLEMYAPDGPGSALVLQLESSLAARDARGALPRVANEIIDIELTGLPSFGPWRAVYAGERV